MIRAASEVSGTLIIIAFTAFAILYGLRYWRQSKRQLDRQEAREEAEFKKEQIT